MREPRQAKFFLWHMHQIKSQASLRMSQSFQSLFHLHHEKSTDMKDLA